MKMIELTWINQFQSKLKFSIVKTQFKRRQILEETTAQSKMDADAGDKTASAEQTARRSDVWVRAIRSGHDLIKALIYLSVIEQPLHFPE